MDPLSITASILTLIASTEAAGRGLHRLWDLQNAPANLGTIRNEVTDFRAMLHFVKDALVDIQRENPSANLSHVQSAIKRSADAVRRLDDLITTKLSRVASGDDKNLEINVRHRGFFKVQRLQKVAAELKDAKVTLSAALTAINYIQLRSKVPRMDLAIESIEVVPSSGIASTTSEAGNGQSTTDHSITQSIEKIIVRSSELFSAPTSIRITTTSTSVNCDPFCSCKCHLRLRGNSPRSLQSLFGVLFYQFTGTPSLTRRSCNSADCRAHGGSVKFEYWFPTWLLPLVLRITGTWNHLDGIQGIWSLQRTENIPRSEFGVFNVLQQAKEPRQLEMFLDMSKLSARANCDQISLLDLAVQYEKMDMCEMLLRRGADMFFRRHDQRCTAEYAWWVVLGSPEGQSPLQGLRPALEESGTLELMDFNIIHRIVTGLIDLDLEQMVNLYPELVDKPDSFGQTPLFWAVARDDIPATLLLISKGAKVRSRNHVGATPLHCVRHKENARCAKALIDARADVNALNSYHLGGRSPLYFAFRQENLELVELLLQSGANPDLGDGPAIIAAAIHGRVDMLEALYKHRADIEKCSPDGYSAVMFAANYNRTECVRFLVSKNARLNLLGSDDDSILDLVACYANTSIMKILTNARICGLPMDTSHVERYWEKLENHRNVRYSGEREGIDVERTAFKRLLDSIRSIDDGEITSMTDDGEASDEEIFMDALE